MKTTATSTHESTHSNLLCRTLRAGGWLAAAGLLAACSGEATPVSDEATAGAEPTGEAKQADSSTTSWDFGGAFGYVNGNPVPNPATGAASCPAGYTSTGVLGTLGVDYPVSFCSRPHQSGADPLYDFGGMWGYVGGALVNNPITHAASCPGGFTAQEVLGTVNVDYPVYVCYQPHVAGTTSAYGFGGMWGYVNGAPAANAATGAASCPAGFTDTTVLGITNVDYPLHFCWESLLPYGRGVGTVPTSCPAGEVLDAGLCYPACAAGYTGVATTCSDGSSYGRGVGTVPTSCAAGYVLSGLLCYPACAAGYTDVGPVCWQICPPGYTDTGAFCTYSGPLTTTCSGWANGLCQCPANYTDTGLWCTASTISKASYGDTAGIPPTSCPAGEVLDAGLCYPACAGGYTGVGPVCWPWTYDRGVGTVPTSCPGGQVLDAGLCYPACAAGYTGVGPLCWSAAINLTTIASSACNALYDPNVSSVARGTGSALTFGFGAGMAAFATVSAEAGVAYGASGEFGCYFSTCEGVVTDVAISAWGAFGMLGSFTDVAGNSIVTATGLSVDIPDVPVSVGGVMGLVTDTSSDPLGFVFDLSASVSPDSDDQSPVQLSLGAETCQTWVLRTR